VRWGKAADKRQRGFAVIEIVTGVPLHCSGVDVQNVGASKGDHMRKFAVLFIAAVLSLTCVVPVYAKHKANPEAQAAQQRAKRQRKELKKRAKAQQKESKRLKSSR
jgi:mannitol-specific phosphotransferase system IIBC component